MSNTYGADSLGVIFSGTSGQAYNDTRLINLAAEHGYDTGWLGQDSPDVAGPSWSDYSQEEQEGHPELWNAADEALEHLNLVAVDEGYAFEWVEGDLKLVEHRSEGYACVEIMGTEYCDGDGSESVTMAGLESVRIALPGEDGSGVPTQWDWLNSITIDFDTREGEEEVGIYVSTGDPRGSIRVATLVRTSDGVVTLRGATNDAVKSHEHYAKECSDGYGGPMWVIRGTR